MNFAKPMKGHTPPVEYNKREIKKHKCRLSIFRESVRLLTKTISRAVEWKHPTGEYVAFAIFLVYLSLCDAFYLNRRRLSIDSILARVIKAPRQLNLRVRVGDNRENRHRHVLLCYPAVLRIPLLAFCGFML